MTGHTIITEEEALEKHCKNNIEYHCEASKCMGWPECKKIWERYEGEPSETDT